MTRKPNPASTTSTGFMTRRQSPISRAPAREIGRVEEDRELGQLRGLEPEDARADPPPRAGHVDADTRDEHRDQQHGAEDQERADEAPQLVVVEADRDDERRHADHGPDQLAEEEVPRRPVVGERRDRRRREHHDHADDVQHGDGGREQHRGRRRPRLEPRCRLRLRRRLRRRLRPAGGARLLRGGADARTPAGLRLAAGAAPRCGDDAHGEVLSRSLARISTSCAKSSPRAA